MIIYGIGRAIVDYYVEGRIDRDFMERVFGRLPDGIPPSSKAPPLHLEGTVFSLVVDAIGSLNDFSLLKEAGGTCVNILKTIARLDTGAVCFFSGTVGGNSLSPSFKLPPSILEADEDGLFFNESLERAGVHSKLKVSDGLTGRCLVLPKQTPCNPRIQQGGAYLALASPAVSAEIAEEQVVFPEDLQCTLVEGMELDKVWFKQRLLSAPSPLAIACGAPFGAKNTAVFLKEWNQRRQKADIVSGSNSQRANSTDFPLLVLANDLEARILEQEGINFVEWSAKKNILFAITHGCGGSSCYFNGARLFTPATHIPEELIVDATGAGDVFAGAFMAHLGNSPTGKKLTMQKLQAALEQASTAAGKVIQVPLCQTSIL